MNPLRSQLLKLSLPLIPTHGFTRQTLSLSVLSLPVPHEEPLSERAVSNLFGEGDTARATLTNAWLDDARQQMNVVSPKSIRDVLSHRLRHNEPVLDKLPEVFAMLATASDLPVLDPRPGISHALKIADEACRIVEDTTTGTAWYTRRAALGAIYGAAELHQFASPKTAYDFLDELLASSFKLETTLSEAQIFANYVTSSLAGIARSRGVL